MLMLGPGDYYYGVFCVCDGEGAAVDADSLPVATATRNGSDDGAFSLTVTKLATGRYKITGTVPSGYDWGDVAHISVAATVDGVAGGNVVDVFVVGPNAEQQQHAKASQVNKHEYSTEDGERTIYDDDGTTELLAQTITTEDDGATIIETPS